MDFRKQIGVNELVEKYGLSIIDNRASGDILGLNEIHKVKSGDLTFVDVAKYYEKALNSNASFILINKAIDCPEGKCLILTENPFKIYNQIAFEEFPHNHSIDDAICKTSTIDPSTIIYPNVYIADRVTIGKNCVIYPNVTIYPNTMIGDNVIIHSNSSIGSDAFYYNRQEGEYVKMHTIGTTMIEDNVEIGSNCTIDSGVSGLTRIGKGTKLDNQIHIAHGVEVGEHCLLCAQVAIAGKTKIGNNVQIYGKVGISKGLIIGDNAIILASSNVDKNLEGNQRYYGSPAQEARQAMKYHATLRMLPEVLTKFKHLLKDKSFAEL